MPLAPRCSSFRDQASIVEISEAAVTVDKNRDVRRIDHALDDVDDLRPARFVGVPITKRRGDGKTRGPEPSKAGTLGNRCRKPIMGFHQKCQFLERISSRRVIDDAVTGNTSAPNKIALLIVASINSGPMNSVKRDEYSSTLTLLQTSPLAYRCALVVRFAGSGFGPERTLQLKQQEPCQLKSRCYCNRLTLRGWFRLLATIQFCRDRDGGQAMSPCEGGRCRKGARCSRADSKIFCSSPVPSSVLTSTSLRPVSLPRQHSSLTSSNQKDVPESLAVMTSWRLWPGKAPLQPCCSSPQPAFCFLFASAATPSPILWRNSTPRLSLSILNERWQRSSRTSRWLGPRPLQRCQAAM